MIGIDTLAHTHGGFFTPALANVLSGCKIFNASVGSVITSILSNTPISHSQPAIATVV